MVVLLPFIDSFQRVDLRTRAFNVPPCKVRECHLPHTEGVGFTQSYVGSRTLAYEQPSWWVGNKNQKVEDGS
jgi:hypothetical protein